MPVPAEVLQLVARFEAQREAYLSGAYNETQLRREFLDPFFQALGWDVDNRQGYAEAYKDVVHEDAIKVGGVTKAPDYSFRIGGHRKFFVEAKRPSVNIKEDVDPAYQLRRYAWSAKLPLSILTDFEELAVYDCRIKPVLGDKSSTGRTLYFRHSEYTDRWEEIASIFSREAVLKGSFDRYADSNRKKRGTAEVDAAFLAEIEGWRESLARNLAARNPKLEQRELNFAVQRIVDRIIFLRICEDRAIENYGRLQGLLNGPHTYARLCDQFREADARYNSGLFHFRPEKGRGEEPDELTLGLKLDDKALKEVIESLYFPESPYEFSVLPPDILGQVYEQFLGKVIRLTAGHQAKVEDKPEVKKAGGVYYTPTYIVDYIVKHTVGKLLEGKTLKQADALTVLDPACGSGSFLIGAYQLIMDWYRDRYAVAPDKHRKQLYQGPGGAWRLTTPERKRILLNNIYGVDIDPQAVEVTKLSLLLKVLEGESSESLQHELALFRQRALPDLGNNIKCGNSLIGPEFYDQMRLDVLDEAERFRINAFDWKAEFPGVLKGKDGGFDAVVGNPPYGADYSEHEKQYFQHQFSYSKGKPETYIFFLERGISLLCPRGRLGMITPNAWLTNYYGVQIRRHVLAKTKLDQVVDLEPVRVFSGATVDTVITVVANEAPKPSEKHDVLVLTGSPDRRFTPQFQVPQSTWSSDDEAVINLHTNLAEAELLRKLDGLASRFDDIVEYSQGVIPYLTKEEGIRNSHIAQLKRGKGWLPLLESASQVRCYEVEEPKAFIHYGPWLNRSREARFFFEPKILFHRLRKKLPRQLVGAIELRSVVNRHALSNLILRDPQEIDVLYAILAIFNSRLTNWWFAKRFGLLMEVGGFKVGRIPLPPKWVDVFSELAHRARKLEALHAKRPRVHSTSEVEGVRREIDRLTHDLDLLVYEFYHLTAAEIRLVEEATA